MKRTLTINISGTVFHIDEDAYEKLQEYLLNINQHFGSDPEGREIIMDIEARIAELFQEKIEKGQEVIGIPDVDQMIEIMGRPEDFIDEEEMEEKKKYFSTKGKRFYRDPDNRILGGVCSGMGAYFNLDPVIFRLLFVLFFFISWGLVLLVYLLFWIVVPKAKNTAQRLEMRGEDVNIGNIQRSIKDEFQSVKDNYQKFRESPSYEKGQQRVAQFGSVVGSALRVILKAFVILVGVTLLIGGIIAIIGLIGSLLFSHSFLGFFPWESVQLSGILQFLPDSSSLVWMWVAIGLVIAIPLIAIIYLGAKLIFRFKSNNTLFGLGSFALWIIAIIALIGIGASQFTHFRNTANYTKRDALTTTNDTIYLRVQNDQYSNYVGSSIYLDDMRVANIEGENILIGRPDFDIKKSETEEVMLVIRTNAKGKEIEDAQKSARNVEYKYAMRDSVLNLAPWYTIKEDAKWRDQEVDITLYIPEGTTIYMYDSMLDIIYDIENISNTYDREMTEKFWTMKRAGLTLVD